MDKPATLAGHEISMIETLLAKFYPLARGGLDKDGWCTVLFQAFLADKIATLTMKGGNTESLYKLSDCQDERLLMAKSLQEQHPDVTKITWKWGRWQHQVDYRPFRNNVLRKKLGIVIPEGVNNYGMRLVKREEAAYA